MALTAYWYDHAIAEQQLASHDSPAGILEEAKTRQQAGQILMWPKPEDLALQPAP